jgi:hypothetical protein
VLTRRPDDARNPLQQSALVRDPARLLADLLAGEAVLAVELPRVDPARLHPHQAQRRAARQPAEK